MFCRSNALIEYAPTKAGNGLVFNVLVGNTDDNRASQLKSCIEATDIFLLHRKDALEIIEKILLGIKNNWNTVCDESEVSEVDKNLFKNRQFLNPYTFENLDSDCQHFLNIMSDFK